MRSVFIKLFILLIFGNILTTHSQNYQNASCIFSGSTMRKLPASYNTLTDRSLVANFSAEAIIDGNSNTMWCSASKSKFPYVFEIEFIETYMLNSLEIDNHTEKDYPTTAAKLISVEVSPSKANPVFKEILRTELESNKVHTFDIPETEARLIRLIVYSNHGHKQYTELTEFSALGRTKVRDIKTINVSGVWTSTWGIATINQKQTSLDGKYTFNNGVIKYGGISRNKITYYWYEYDIKRGGGTILYMNEEGNELVGIWCYETNWNQYGFWRFKRNKTAPIEPVPVEEKITVDTIKPVVVEEIPVNKEMEKELIQNKKLILYGINFAHNSSDILSESEVVLAQLISILKKNPSVKIRIEGHTDSDGSDQYNLTLSQKRADAVKAYLIRAGIESERILALGKGEQFPIADNSNEIGKSLNRRVEIHEGN